MKTISVSVCHGCNSCRTYAFCGILHWTCLSNMSCANKKAYATPHFLFMISLRKLCGSVAEGLRKLKSHFVALIGTKIRWGWPTASNSILFLVIFDNCSSFLLQSRHFICWKIHVLRKLAEALRKLSAEAKDWNLKKLMCCGSLRKVAEGFSQKQKSYTPKNSCVAEACGSLRKVICGSKVKSLSLSITFL